MVTEVDADTALVVTVKVAEVLPAGTVTLAGTWAAELSLDRRTCAPPEGAGALRVTVPAEDCEAPVTLAGLSTKDVRETLAEAADCWKSMMAGFGSANETATNFDGEMT